MNQKMYIAILMLAGFSSAWMMPMMGPGHQPDLNATMGAIGCRTNATISLLDNQSNATLQQYAAALQKDEMSLAGYAASGDGTAFWSYFKASYMPDLKAALKGLRAAIGGAMHPAAAMAGCGPVARGMHMRGNKTAPDLNVTSDMIKARTERLIARLDNQTNLSQYATALQTDESALAGFAASSDRVSFVAYVKSNYIPDVEAALKALGKGGWKQPAHIGAFRFRRHGGFA